MNRAYFNGLKAVAQQKAVAFTMVVQSDNAGTSNDDQFTILTAAGSVYNYIVKTSDGFLATGVTGDITITFPSGSGERLVEITGVFPRILFANGGDRLKVKKVMPNWGVYGVGGGAQGNAFLGCNNLDEISAEGKWFDVVTGAFAMFSNCGLTSFPNRGMGACTDFRLAWQNNNLTSFPLIDTSSGTTFQQAWFNNNLTEFPLIDVSSGTNFFQTWQNNNLTTWLPNFFDLCPATNYAGAFGLNALDADGVNNILISVNKARVDGVSSGAGTLGIGGGTNEAPTGAGLTAKNELIAAGWSVSTN